MVLNMKKIYISLTTEIAKILLTIITILCLLNLGLFYVQANYNIYPKQTPANILIDFGPYGTYSPYLDQEKNRWTLGLWEEGAIYPGTKTIKDLQKDGGKVVFVMPYDGEINNSGGEILINGKKWRNGNPITNSKGETKILKGEKVEIIYEENSPSAGFQIWFLN